MPAFTVSNASFSTPDGDRKPLPTVAFHALSASSSDDRIVCRLSDLPRFTITFRWSVYDLPRHRLCAGPRGLWRGCREN